MIIKAGSHKLEKREAVENSIYEPVLWKKQIREREMEKLYTVDVNTLEDLDKYIF